MAAAAMAACNAGNIVPQSTAASGGDNQQTLADAPDSGNVTLTGSVGDGPIIGARISVTDARGKAIAATTSDATATYSVQIPESSAYPVIITATGGTDMVTGSAPAYPLVTAASGLNVRVANVNPLSTLIVRTAQQSTGGLTTESLADAAKFVLRDFNGGLDSTVADPITTPIDGGNAAMMIKASEVLAETIRRSANAVQANNAAINQGTVVLSLAADLTDGALDGAGAAGSDKTLAVTAAIISGQVLIEALSNNLSVNGAPAAALLDNALHTTYPTAVQSVSQQAVTGRMLSQIDLSLQTAEQVTGDTSLVTLQDQVDKLQPGMSPGQAAALVPASYSADLQKATVSAATLSGQRLDAISEWLRSAYGTADPIATPPIVTFSVSPLKVNPGGSVTLDWAYTAGATCQTAGPLPWQASASTGQTTVNGLSEPGTFTLTCSNGAGTASSSYSVSLNSAPVMPAEPTASPGWISGGQTAQLHVTASDPDHDVLTYSWQASSGTISGTGADALYTPPPAGAGTTVHITVTVADSGGLATSGAVDVVVQAPATVTAPLPLSVSGASASSYDTANNLVPGNATDGSVQTSWTVLTMPQWIVLDLGGQQLVSGVKMLIDGTNGVSGLSYTVETSADAQTWASAFDGTSVAAAPQWTQADFTPVYARYLRISLSAQVLSDSANVYEVVPMGRNISTAPTNAGVTVSWDPNTDSVNGYVLYVGASSSTVQKQIAKVANPTSGFDPNSPSLRFDSWYDFGLLPGDNVCFKLQAYSTQGYSALSPAVCQTI